MVDSLQKEKSAGASRTLGSKTSMGVRPTTASTTSSAASTPVPKTNSKYGNV